MLILGIDTSCDDTSVAIVEVQKGKIKVLANIVASQIKIHRPYGGIVPQLAAKAHSEKLIKVLQTAFLKSNKKPWDIELIGVTTGPGLIPSLLVGTIAAKTLSWLWQKPLVAVNHIEGHIFANFIGANPKPVLSPSIWLRINSVEGSQISPKDPSTSSGQALSTSSGQAPSTSSSIPTGQANSKKIFPVLCLVVSGGHTMLVLSQDFLKYKIVGQTRDDAAGEAFDKVAKLLALGYPGGPIIEKVAKRGDSEKFKFPRPMIASCNFDFSFSGLKTAVLYELKSTPTKIKKQAKFKSDICASFQQAVIDVLVAKTIKAAKVYRTKSIMLGGGVAANKKLRQYFKEAIKKELPAALYFIPPPSYCLDNAAMIAASAYFHFIQGKTTRWQKLKANAEFSL